MMTEKKDPRQALGEALIEIAEKNDRVIALSADSYGGSGLGPFKGKFPERLLEFGVMEQGIIGFASGLATTGMIPFVVAITPFVTSRPFEMFRNDIGYMRTNVKVVGRCSGFTYSTLGPTHYSLEDVALIRAIPDVVILSPGDPVEVKKAVHAAADTVGPMYLRIGNQPLPIYFGEDHPFQIGKGVLMKDGTDVTIIGTGFALHRAYDAALILEKVGIHARLINIHTIRPLDKELILQAARETGKIVTVEEHYVIGGLGSAVAELLSLEHPTPVRMLGVPHQFAENGPYDELLGLYGLLPDQIAETVKTFVQGVGD
jgi:transketolase